MWLAAVGQFQIIHGYSREISRSAGENAGGRNDDG